jgi:GNAT superfamily N-acetyltransferase
MDEDGIGSEGATGGVTIRVRVVADDAAIVDLRNRQEPLLPILSVEEWRAARPVGGGGDLSLVAARGGSVLGYSSLSTAWWTGRSDVVALDLRVGREHRRRGVGTSLLVATERAAGARGISQFLAWGPEEGRHFGALHGFSDTGQCIEECRLMLAEANLEPHHSIEVALAEEGIRIAQLSEIGIEDERFLRDLHALWEDGGAAPDSREPVVSLDAWRKQVLEGPGLSPEWHWVALVDRQPVGTTFLMRHGAESAENDYTAVRPSYRGRGIARALKARAIRWGQANGIRSFFTSSEIGNHRMLAINYSLGYQPTGRRWEIAKELPATDRAAR